ncbi:hypothetical protein AYI68_g324 [Smittium mucronatum]|uniref:Uncharacterized protein n=1 Tax=Smittium mucronatum TaxID=133383 RepID=A0A1R0H8P6_9FUNG|nr:hypothetical protein AYI68_g324 [Smittium mucronatum]
MRLTALASLFVWSMGWVVSGQGYVVESCEGLLGGNSLDGRDSSFLKITDKEFDFINDKITEICKNYICRIEFNFGRGRGRGIKANLGCDYSGKNYPGPNSLACMRFLAIQLRLGTSYIRDNSYKYISKSSSLSIIPIRTELKRGQKRAAVVQNSFANPEYPYK